MRRPTQIAIPTLFRVKPGAIDRLGVYLHREHCQSVAVLISRGLPEPLPQRVDHANQGVTPCHAGSIEA